MCVMKRVLLLLILAISLPSHYVLSQDVALKTNLSSDAFLNPNAGLEFGLSRRWTAEVDAQFNGWTLSGSKHWKHWSVQPGVRYWLCDRFSGHFFGAHLHGGQYNVGGLDVGLNILGTDFRKLKDSRYQGWFVGGGVSYGYSFILSRHLNLEPEIGAGYSYTRYDKYRCAGCGRKVDTGISHHYFGLTKLALNLVYLF